MEFLSLDHYRLDRGQIYANKSLKSHSKRVLGSRIGAQFVIPYRGCHPNSSVFLLLVANDLVEDDETVFYVVVDQIT